MSQTFVIFFYQYNFLYIIYKSLQIEQFLINCRVFQYLDYLRQNVHDNLKQLVTSPSVEMQDIPPDLLSPLENTEEQDPDVRNHQDDIDKR